MNSIVPTCPLRSSMEIEMPSRRLDEVTVVLSEGAMVSHIFSQKSVAGGHQQETLHL